MSVKDLTASERKTAQLLFSGSMAEGLVAGVAAVLAIIGLIGGFPTLLLSVATITLGAALLFEGASISARFYDLLAETSTSKVTAAELSSGTTAESLAGITGIALGILALVGIVPLVLIPSAAIVIGGCIILGAGANARLNALGAWKSEQHPVAREAAQQAVRAATGFQVLVGLGGITLGILALSGIEPLTLSLIAILSMSGSLLLSGSALAGRMINLFRS